LKKIITVTAVLAVLALSIASLGCTCGGDVTGSGNLETKSESFDGFTKIEAQTGFQVVVTKASTYSIEIVADDNVHKYIDVSKSGDTLKIKLENGPFYHSVTVKANITMPDLYELDFSGGARATINGFSFTHDFTVKLSGGAQVAGEISTGDIDFSLSGGSQVFLTGSGRNLDINGSGGSQLNLATFSVEDADIDLSGGSQSTVDVSGVLDVNLSGGSRLTYTGNPTMGDIDLSGDSTLNSN